MPQPQDQLLHNRKMELTMTHHNKMDDQTMHQLQTMHQQTKRWQNEQKFPKKTTLTQSALKILHKQETSMMKAETYHVQQMTNLAAAEQHLRRQPLDHHQD